MKKVLIIGLGKSGMGSAKLLQGKAEVSVYDAKSEDQINEKDLFLLKNMNVKCFFATEPDEPYDEIIVSPAVPMFNPIVKKYMDKGVPVIGEMELSYRYCRGQFVGITGTNGKTTTTTLVGEIFKEAEKPCFVVGNIGNAVSEVCEKAEPETTLVTELSSFQLETIDTFHPHISAILNLSPDHLDRHLTYEAYIKAKGRITENQNLSDYFIYNAKDADTLSFAEGVQNVTKVPFTSAEDVSEFENLPNAAFVKDEYITIRKNGKNIKLCKASELQIPGKHNLENALAAAAICVFADVQAAPIRKVLRSFKGVEHRLEFVREHKGVRYINDSKGTNPDSSIKALESFPGPIILIAGGYDKQLDFTDFIKAFNGKVSYLLLLGQTADKIKETAVKCGFPDDRIFKFNSLEAVVAGADKIAEKGDIVLLSPACASWGMFTDYEQRGREFKRFVKEL